MSVLQSLLNYSLTVFGIGFVIFFHELGHYLAARAVGVRVEAFSVGFGPRLFGFRRGPTDYKLSLIPLGGFVKMAGENPYGPRGGAKDEFTSKSVPQRILVIVAGVVMNVIFALIAVPLAFMFGVPVKAPVLGAVTPGGPVWEAGLRAGDRMISVGGSEALAYEDVAMGLLTGGAEVPVVYSRDGRTREATVRPVADPESGRPHIGVDVAYDLWTANAEWIVPFAAPETPEGHRARAGLLVGDVLTAIDDIPLSEWAANKALKADLALRFVERRVKVRRDGVETTIVVPPIRVGPEAEAAKRFGLRAGSTLVTKVSERGASLFGLRPGDRVVSVGGVPVGIRDDVLFAVSREPRGSMTVVGADGEERSHPVPEGAVAAELCTEVLFSSEIKTVSPEIGGPADRAGIRPGDELVSIDGVPAVFTDLARVTDKRDPVKTTFRRGRGPDEVIVSAALTAEPIAPNGALLPLTRGAPLKETVRASFGDAWGKGANHALGMTKRVVQTIQSIFTRRVSGNNLGGVITIFRESAASNEESPALGLLFMAFISINLAILNILPIPVLDGGWLALLLIEAVRKKPAPERVVAGAQWVGLALLLALMIYATWNDVARLFA